LIPENIIKVGMAEVKTAQKPHMLTTPSVGSCLVIILYDELKGIGSLAHIMLPDINLAKSKKNRAKFANTAVEIMLKEMIDLGAVRRRIKAGIVGGANMFPSVIRGGAMHMGARNIAAVKDELRKRKISLVAEDTEESYGRSVEFFLETGIVRTKSALHGNKVILGGEL
jgi:chemotaxis protein CheD